MLLSYAGAFGFAARLIPRALPSSDFFFFVGGAFGITALTAFFMAESSCGSKKSAFLLMVMLEDEVEGCVFEDVLLSSGPPVVDEVSEEVPSKVNADGPVTLENTLQTISVGDRMYSR